MAVLIIIVLNRFAAAPGEVKKEWDKFTKDYFLQRSTLVSVFLLIDASIPAKKIDLEYASWLGQNKVGLPISDLELQKKGYFCSSFHLLVVEDTLLVGSLVCQYPA